MENPNSKVAEAVAVARALGSQYGIKFNPDTKKHEVAQVSKPFGTPIEIAGGNSEAFDDNETPQYNSGEM